MAASLFLHAIAFAAVALLPPSSLKALDLSQQDVDVELSFLSASESGDSPLIPAPEPRMTRRAATELRQEDAPAPLAVTNSSKVIESVAPAAVERGPSDTPIHSAEGGETMQQGAQGAGLQALAAAWLQGVGRMIFANAVRHYPALARQSRLEGTVALAITIDGVGRITHVVVKRSSGYEVLDRAALAAVHAIQKVPPPPVALGWQPRALTLPIVYKLR